MSKNCTHCPARFEDDREALAVHVESFHPAGAPKTVAITSPAVAAAVGWDFGPAISGLASDLGAALAAIRDHEERLAALEDGRRSDIDLTVLAEQVAPRLGQLAATAVDEGPSYRDLQAQAKDLGIPATGSREELAVAIADEELRAAEEAGTPPAT